MQLHKLIQEAGGWISFEQFMTHALYNPEVGYYTSRIRNIGRRGDFITSSSENDFLGQALARWIKSQKRRLNFRAGWHVIEIGGGSGELARSIFRSMGFLDRLGLTYHLVEISEPLRLQQAATLRGRPVFWHATVAEALEVAGHIAIIFSNELVDAFPCRRLQKTKNVWSEWGLEFDDGVIRETLRPISAEACDFLQSTAIVLSNQEQAGTVEVHSAYRTELRKMVELLKEGVVLTIDYGDRFPEVYHRRPTGTIRGYFHHQRVTGEDLYARLGHQDITADVNFSDLENWGRHFGLVNERFQTQREFILGFLGNRECKTTGEARLLDPVGAGNAFKVLQQSKGLAV